MSSQVMEEAAAAGCSEAAAELATEEAAALLAALLEQPDSAPAAAAPRALRADARMKFLREILFIVRNPFFSLLVFFSQNILLHRTQFDVFLTIFIIIKSLPKEKFNFPVCSYSVFLSVILTFSRPAVTIGVSLLPEGRLLL